MIENRNGLVVNGMATQADGYAEREAAKSMMSDARQSAGENAKLTQGVRRAGIRGCVEGQEFVAALKEMKVSPHVAQNNNGRRSAVPYDVAASEGYSMSQQKRKRAEQPFGWGKLIGGLRQVMVHGLEKVDQALMLIMPAYNVTLTRMRTLGQLHLQKP